jgi:hypothetical protein
MTAPTPQPIPTGTGERSPLPPITDPRVLAIVVPLLRAARRRRLETEGKR